MDVNIRGGGVEAPLMKHPNRKMSGVRIAHTARTRPDQESVLNSLAPSSRADRINMHGRIHRLVLFEPRLALNRVGVVLAGTRVTPPSRR